MPGGTPRLPPRAPDAHEITRKLTPQVKCMRVRGATRAHVKQLVVVQRQILDGGIRDSAKLIYGIIGFSGRAHLIAVKIVQLIIPHIKGWRNPQHG